MTTEHLQMAESSLDSNSNLSLERCEHKYSTYETPPGEVFCNWTWDSVLCWPPTKAATTASLKCPPKTNGVDPTKFAFKRCSIDGRWEGASEGDFSKSQGWTNYTTCFTPEMLEIMRQVYQGSNESAIYKLEVAYRTRILEIAGFSLSLVALVISLVIFYRFTSLHNNRTRIHKNLFLAMVIQVVIRLTLYIDQYIIRRGYNELKQDENLLQGIDNTPFLCEGSYILLEYARTAMFMWMFIEGLYLHNKVTVTVFHEKSYYALYTAAGWGIPILLTAVWASMTTYYFKINYNTKCWYGYNLLNYFWILEGPRLAVVLLNFLFLLNIIRVLVVKLRQSHTSEIEQVRKAVRAAVVLVPLLGITNILSMIQDPLGKTPVEFAIWSYSTHFLTSFQGIFIAFLYCFLNGEVRLAVMKSVAVYFSLRTTQYQMRRNSGFSGMYVTAVENQADQESEMPNMPREGQGNVKDNNKRENSRRQRSSAGSNESRWVRLCCRGSLPQPPDDQPHETRV